MVYTLDLKLGLPLMYEDTQKFDNVLRWAIVRQSIKTRGNLVRQAMYKDRDSSEKSNLLTKGPVRVT